MSRIAKGLLRRGLHYFGYRVVNADTPWLNPHAKNEAVASSGADMVLDVGANIGQFATGCRRAGFRGAIASFEPQAEPFEQLLNNSRSDEDWTAHRIALADRPGRAAMHVSAASVSSSLLPLTAEHVRHFKGTEEIAAEEVAVTTLDEYTEDARLDFRSAVLKLDVQGLELKVLSGSSSVLERTQMVVSEVNFASLFEGQSRWWDVCAHLEDNGFELQFICEINADAATSRMLFADVVYTRK